MTAAIGIRVVSMQNMHMEHCDTQSALVVLLLISLYTEHYPDSNINVLVLVLLILTEDLLERMVQKGGVKSLLMLLTKSIDLEAQRFSALALGNISSAGKIIFLTVK